MFTDTLDTIIMTAEGAMEFESEFEKRVLLMLTNGTLASIIKKQYMSDNFTQERKEHLLRLVKDFRKTLDEVEQMVESIECID